MNIILVDDHKIIRDGLKSMIDRHPDMRVIGETDSGRKAVELARTMQPDIAIMDIAMPDLNGIEATQQIIKESSAIKVIALSMHSDARFVARMLAAGASGYLLKDTSFQELIVAIHQVVQGRIHLSQSITDTVIRDYVRRVSVSQTTPVSSLTSREREVLQLVAEGKTTREIALLLGVSIKTIETHRRRMMEKLNIDNVADLTKYAIIEGLTSVNA
ncbi:MAG: response regulator transcription factor [Deltaproteobacteria bacterium]|nr:response regulator transcription factor [Deltaproteobacteria bacterium]